MPSNVPQRILRLDDSLWSDVLALAAINGVSATQVVRDSISEYARKRRAIIQRVKEGKR